MYQLPSSVYCTKSFPRVEGAEDKAILSRNFFQLCLLSLSQQRGCCFPELSAHSAVSKLLIETFFPIVVYHVIQTVQLFCICTVVTW
eukprot:m.197004 g.197004  ORF g.197004 m.197004 type:complete len:87 (+) comp39537_c0_seq8:1068-1328(+)